MEKYTNDKHLIMGIENMMGAVPKVIGSFRYQIFIAMVLFYLYFVTQITEHVDFFFQLYFFKALFVVYKE